MMYLLTKIVNVVKRAFVSRSLPDDGDSGIVQVSYLGKSGRAEVVSPYGLSVRLPEGVQVILFAVQAQENNRAVIGYSQEKRFKNLEEGEVEVGNPGTGASVKFDKNGNIIITSTEGFDVNVISSGKVKVTATGNVDIDSPLINLGVGGVPIARVGDSVLVNGITGVITSGGVNTSL